jgi:hypothetical protein
MLGDPPANAPIPRRCLSFGPSVVHKTTPLDDCPAAGGRLERGAQAPIRVIVPTQHSAPLTAEQRSVRLGRTHTNQTVAHERRQLRTHYDCPWVPTFRGLLANVPALDFDDWLPDPDPTRCEIDIAPRIPATSERLPPVPTSSSNIKRSSGSPSRPAK